MGKQVSIPVLAGGITPSAIVKYLDQYVIGQHDAKKTLAVAVYAHYRKSGRMSDGSASTLTKSNVLLIGPTGTGKTLMCETLSRAIDVPFVTADAPSLAQTEYVGDEIEAMLQRLVDKAGGDLDRARRGIVFIDEVDKLKTVGGQRGTSGEAVQNALLKIMEGAPVKLRDGRYVDTTDVLFICGGAFVGLDQILTRTHSFGFISTGEDDNQRILDRLNARVKPTDLFEFGLIPEFAGRLPVVARLTELSKAMLVQIVTEPRDAIFRSFQEIFRTEGVELVVAPVVFEQMADLAIEYRIGARSLRGIFEEMITPALYLVPDRKDIRKVVFRSLFEEADFVCA
jgi:ATP-dependent Clp protease ATP-binding subunit ClpX